MFISYRISFKKVLLILLASLSLFIFWGCKNVEGSNNKNSADRPNILFILADDLGWGDVSIQNNTGDIQTPNIDNILEGGIRFTNFYSNSCICSPSRAALLTGQFPDMVGVPGMVRDIPAQNWAYLDPSVKLLPEYLKEADYNTCLVGKWNLGLTLPNLPNNRGFDQFYGFLDDMMDDYYTHLRNGKNFMRINGKEVNPQGHATNIFTNWAIDYIEKQKNKENPFFLYLAYNAPHTPIQPPDKWLNKVKDREPELSEKRTKLVALIEHLDYNIGLVLNKLKELKMLDNTIVIFTSDNGGLLRVGANNGLYRGGKLDMYEGGLREPAGIMWKNKIKPGQINDNFIMMMDWLPTLCELSDVKTETGIDGMSILPILKGEKEITNDRTVFYVRREGSICCGGHAYYAARYKDQKILQNRPYDTIEYYNIKKDPYEEKPLKKNGNKQFRGLHQKLTEHIRLTGSVLWEKPAD